MRTIIRAAVFAALLLALTATSSRAQDEIQILQKRFNAVKKVVDDPLVDEAGIRKALRDLENLAKATREFEEEDLEPDDPRATLARGIVDTLRQVESRVPAQFGRRVEKRPGFPVPRFEDRKNLAGLASQLNQAQKDLARHVRKPNAPENETEKKLYEVSKAQENLAWEAGWPFTKAEAEQVRRTGKLTEEAYGSRLMRGIERINEQIASETRGNGRDEERPFVIHQSTSAKGKQRFAAHLEESRRVDSLPANGVREFNEAETEALKGGPDEKRR